MITRSRTILAGLLLVGVALGPRCATTPHPDVPPEPPIASGEMEEMSGSPGIPVATNAAAAPGNDPFRSSVRPVLSTRCAPCHEPGGKMYARLPFDDPKTVSANAPAMMRRLKGDDRAALERWVEELAAATPAR